MAYASQNCLSLSYTSYTHQFQVQSAAAAAESLQSCLTMCDPIDSSPPGCPIPGILQARTLECVAISFSNAWKWKVKVKSLSRVRPSVTPWTAAFQAPPPMGFSRQKYWSGVSLPSPKYSLKWQYNCFQSLFLCKSNFLSYCRFLKEYTDPSICRENKTFVWYFIKF